MFLSLNQILRPGFESIPMSRVFSHPWDKELEISLKSPKAKITRYQNWKERHTTNVVASAAVVGEYKNPCIAGRN